MTEASPAGSSSPAIEFWFDFSSPYGYFAAQEIDRRMARFGRAVVWRPYLLGAVFRLTGMAPLATMPLRGDYARRDWQRIARKLGVRFRLPASHPYPAQIASRAYYWLADHRPEAARPFALAAFAEHFVRQTNPVTIGAVAAIAARFIGDTAPLEAWLAAPDAKAALRRMTDEALAKGVFGSPFFIADGEPFWGWDRIPMLEDWLESGCRWP